MLKRNGASRPVSIWELRFEEYPPLAGAEIIGPPLLETQVPLAEREEYIERQTLTGWLAPCRYKEEEPIGAGA